MNTYKKVLIASDLNTHSDKIVQQGTALAKCFGAQVYLIHIIEHSPIAYGGEFSVTVAADYEAELEHQAKLALLQQAEKFGIANDHQIVENGTVKLAVAEAVKKFDIDLLIIGHNNRTGLEKLLGSHANAIMHEVTCDILTIKKASNEG